MLFSSDSRLSRWHCLTSTSDNLPASFESRLIRRFQQGDAQALSTLFEAYADRVYAYAHHVLGNREDAEEVAGEAFLRAFRRAADYRGDCPFRGWLFTIARNLCRDRQRQPRLLTVPADEARDQAVHAEDGRAALRADVQSALRELPEEYQDVLILCDVQQWDAREAGEMLERSTAATKSLLYRARRALRDRLTESWREEV
jgi:RNA polymerase sigma-70 factor (ECF subfamily)